MDYDTVKEKIEMVCSDSGEIVVLGMLNGKKADMEKSLWKVPVKLKFFGSNSEWEISDGAGDMLIVLHRGRNMLECVLCPQGGREVKVWTYDIGKIEGIYAEYELRDERIMKPVARLVETMK